MAVEKNTRVISPGRWVQFANSAHRSITRRAAVFNELALGHSAFVLRISFDIRAFVIRHSERIPVLHTPNLEYSIVRRPCVADEPAGRV